MKFDELGEIPQVKRVFIDGVPVCLSGETSLVGGIEISGRPSDDFPMTAVKPSGILLSDLQLQAFPNVTQIPQQVDNVS